MNGLKGNKRMGKYTMFGPWLVKLAWANDGVSRARVRPGQAGHVISGRNVQSKLSNQKVKNYEKFFTEFFFTLTKHFDLKFYIQIPF